MTPRKLRLELKKLDDYGRDELIQEQKRLNHEAKIEHKKRQDDQAVSDLENLRFEFRKMDKPPTQENEVGAHGCGYKNAIMQIIDEKESSK